MVSVKTQQNRESRLLGKEYYFLKILSVENKNIDKGNFYVFCKCKCGNETKVVANNILKGNTKSCGCHRKKGLRLTHGNSSHSNISRTYNTWLSMKQRCGNKNHQAYKNYGARGITICEEWMSFNNFLSDMGQRPDGRTLDRIDNNGNYNK